MHQFINRKLNQRTQTTTTTTTTISMKAKYNKNPCFYRIKNTTNKLTLIKFTDKSYIPFHHHQQTCLSTVRILEHIYNVHDVQTSAGLPMQIHLTPCLCVVVQHFECIFEASCSVRALHHFAIDAESEHCIRNFIGIGDWRCFRLPCVSKRCGLHCICFV